ncbi:MAG: hypothetical protein FJ319_08175 [SAR202 cluster bacterium]|nr:hypothetical protein [SAR202 cluster bacterium]
MPEAPELEVIKDYLNERIVGATIREALVLKPSVLRSFAGDFVTDIRGRTFDGKVERRGKFMSYPVSGERLLLINNMLTGAFQYCPPSERRLRSTCFVLGLSNGLELRYVDEKQMGRVYYLQPAQVELVPQINEYGPDVLDEITFEEFRQRLKPFRGEIKGVLTNGRFISGIGNAYSDEILFAAMVYPFKKVSKLS